MSIMLSQQTRPTDPMLVNVGQPFVTLAQHETVIGSAAPAWRI